MNTIPECTALGFVKTSSRNVLYIESGHFPQVSSTSHSVEANTAQCVIHWDNNIAKEKHLMLF